MAGSLRRRRGPDGGGAAASEVTPRTPPPPRSFRLRESPVYEPLRPPPRLCGGFRLVCRVRVACFPHPSRTHGSRRVSGRGVGAIFFLGRWGACRFLPEKKISGQKRHGLRWFASCRRSSGYVSPGRHCSRADRFSRSCVNRSVFGQKLGTSRRSRRTASACRARWGGGRERRNGRGRASGCDPSSASGDGPARAAQAGAGGQGCGAKQTGEDDPGRGERGARASGAKRGGRAC